MEWFWKKIDLMRVWPQLVGVAERKAQHPAVNPALHFIQVRSEKGLLHFKATDLDVQLDHTLNWGESLDFACLIPARKFWDICRALPDDAHIKLSVDEGEQIRLTAGKSRFRLTSLPFAAYPELPTWNNTFEGFNLLAGDLKNIWESVCFAASEQDSRLYLNGVLCDIQTEKFTVVASDGHRLAEASVPVVLGSGFQKRVIVPRRSIIDMCRLLGLCAEKTIRLEFSDKAIALKSTDSDNEWCFTARLIDSRYPEHQKFFPNRALHQVSIPLQELKQALLRVSILTENNPIVALSFSSGHLELRTDNPGQEEATEELSVPYEGPDCLLRLNIRYCLECLNTWGHAIESVKLFISSPDTALLFEGGGSCHVRYVLMPFRR